MINTVAIMGRLTATPELKTTQNGTVVTSFSIATSRHYDRNKVDFFDCQAWRKNAEFITKYFTKGQLIAIEGSLQTRIYEKDGKKIKITEILVDKVDFCGKKENADEQAQQIDNSIDEYEEISMADEDLPFN